MDGGAELVDQLEEENKEVTMSISAHSLFEFYERCGMQSVVDETIFVNTQAGMNEMGIMMNSVSIKEAKSQYGKEKEDSDNAERCQQVD